MQRAAVAMHHTRQPNLPKILGNVNIIIEYRQWPEKQQKRTLKLLKIQISYMMEHFNIGRDE
jgi:hypothetical protein